ncbi:nuclear transcription factor Y subunit gamma-like isoform X2 [Watersipora subatra]|uniref:nuclear transcription factor Y subunit gamma-like isoform X2 n=1 Tax=Watersipora subatra TaxID=2589382 RepID=UPI00355C2840
MADAEPTFSVTATEEQTESHQWLSTFWPRIAAEIKATKQSDFKTQELPLARIKKIMKLDEDVKMISQEAPLLFAKAAEIFISELALRAWVQTEDSKRRTLQRNDISMAISKFDQFDFLIDIVPRDVDSKPSKRDGGEAVQYYVQTQTGLSGVAQPIQLSQSLPAGAQVVQVQSPQQTNQTVPTIQLTPSQLQAIQQQIGSAQQIVVQSGGEQQQQVFTTNSGAQIQQVQFLQQS